MSENENKYELLANQVYDNINLLTIRKSVKMLCDLKDEDLNEFVQYHSPILIFLLNVLDKQLSSQLLVRMSEESLLYLMAEEFRTILISQMALVSGELDELVDISNYLEVCEKKGLAEDISDSTDKVLSILWDNRLMEGKSHFTYLDSVSEEKRKDLYLKLKDHNVHIALGLMMYSPDHIMINILDDLVKVRPEILKHIPREMIEMRLKKSYDLYLGENIFDNLPEDLKIAIKEIHQTIFEKFHKEFHTIKSIKESELSDSEKRQKILNIVYVVLERVKPSMREAMLGELTARDTITEEDINMLKTIKDLA